jgi:hypothetical protein
MKLRAIICFSVYLLISVCFAFICELNSTIPTDPNLTEEKASTLIVILKAFGQAAVKASMELSLWLRFITICVLINLLFFITLKIIESLTIRKIILLEIVTLSSSFLFYLLLHPLFNWIFGEYHAITFVLATTTFFVTRWEILAKEQFN